MTKKETLHVQILERSYTLLCAPEEKATLLASVALVDKKMSNIHQQMGFTGHDKIAVFAALQIANDLLQLNMQNTTQVESNQRLDAMSKQIDELINPSIKPLI